MTRLEDRVNPGTGTFTAGKFDFSVAVLFNASDTQLTAIRDRFQAGSDVLADATDGQHRFGTVTILNNAGNTARARAEYWVESASGRANATLGLFGIPGAHINMFFPDDFTSLHGFDGNAYTIAHEFGHHAYGVVDEYKGPPDPEGKLGIVHCATADSAVLNYSLMDNYYTLGGRPRSGSYTVNEFCVAANHDPNGDTFQSSFNGESAWETVAKSRFAIVAPLGFPVDAPPASQPVGFVTVQDASNDLLQLMLLVDRSGSMTGDRINYAIGGARGLTRGAAAFNPNVGLASFSDDVTVNLPPSRLGTVTNLNSLLNAIRGLSVGGQTNIGGGLQVALNKSRPAAPALGQTPSSS